MSKPSAECTVEQLQRRRDYAKQYHHDKMMSPEKKAAKRERMRLYRLSSTPDQLAVRREQGRRWRANKKAASPDEACYRTPKQKVDHSEQERQRRARMTPEQRAAWCEGKRRRRAAETPEQKAAHREAKRRRRANMTPEQKAVRETKKKQSRKIRRAANDTNALAAYKRRILHSASVRATKYNLLFEIAECDITFPTCCPVCGVKLFSSGTRGTSPSIDRFVPKFGYVPSNINIICADCNSAKGALDPRDHRALRAAIDLALQRTLGHAHVARAIAWMAQEANRRRLYEPTE